MCYHLLQYAWFCLHLVCSVPYNQFLDQSLCSLTVEIISNYN